MKKTDIFLSSLLVIISSISCFAQNLVPMPIPDRLIKHDLYFSENQTYSSFNNIQSGNYDGNNPSDIIIEIDADVNFTAGSSIIISEETDVSILSDEAQAIFEIKPNEISGAWFAPQYPGEVPKYNKLELGFNLDQFEGLVQNFKNHLEPSLNPFDPDQMDCYMIFTEPSGSQKRVNSFYYEQFSVVSNEWQQEESAYPWRVRFSPDKIGQWKCQFHAEINGQHITSATVTFECTESFTTGYLKTDGKYLVYEENGSPFFSRGHNLYSSGYGIPGPENWIPYRQAFHDLADAGGNFTRVELGPQNGLPYWKPQNSEHPEPSEHDNYFLKMGHMWEYDKMIEICDLREIYFIMFRHHAEIIDPDENAWDGICWPKNPIKTAFDLGTREDFFIDPDAITWRRNCLRYIFSRWGYTPKFAFYGYSEIDAWVQNFEIDHNLTNLQTSLMTANAIENERYKAKSLLMFESIISEKSFIADQLEQTKMMFTNSYKKVYPFEKENERFYFHDDLICFHKYTNDKASAMSGKFPIFKDLRESYSNKPILHEESGYYLDDCKLGDDCGEPNYQDFGRVMACSSIDIKNEIWSSSMMDGIGCSMNYWWTFLHISPEALDYYSAVEAFFDNENRYFWDYEIDEWSKDETPLEGVLGIGPMPNTDIETYYMRSSNRERVLGWAHNSSHYWRNYFHLPCMEQIISNDGVVDNPGIRANGMPIDNYPLAEFHYQQEKYSDKHTIGMTTEIGEFGADSYGGTVKVKGLRKSINDLEVYDFEVYNTTTGDLISSQQVATSDLGVLNLQFPLMDLNNPDFAYKLIFDRTIDLNSQEFIDQNIQEESSSDRFLERHGGVSNDETDLSEILIYPNPAENVLNLVGVVGVNELTLSNSVGKKILSIENVKENRISLDISELSKGVYYVFVVSPDRYITKKFVKI